MAVHEFGHFWVARRLGVRVLRFSIGFGRPILRWQRAGDPTEYCIGWMPLGGYVKMLDECEGEVPAHLHHAAFNRKSIPARAAIVFAGPAFNFLLAIALVWGLSILGWADLPSKVGEVVEESPAAAAGFAPGDTVLAVDGRRMRGWGEQRIYLMNRAFDGATVQVRVRRASGDEETLALDLATLENARFGRQSLNALMGVWPPAPPADVGQVVPGSPAERAGLQPQDRITAIDGEAMADWNALVAYVSARPGQPLTLAIERDGQHLITPAVTETHTLDDGRAFGRIGIYPPPLPTENLNLAPLPAFTAALDYNFQLGVLTLRSFWRMLTNRMDLDNIAGPITIARLAGASAESGYREFVFFLALVSLSLGILNLLPVPVLDGGHLVYLLLEAVTGRPPSEVLLLRGQQIGLVLLAGLMSLAFYQDLARLFGGN